MPKHLSQIRKSSKRWAAGVLARQAERMINTTAPENVKTGQDLIELALILYPDIFLERRVKAQERNIHRRGV